MLIVGIGLLIDSNPEVRKAAGEFLVSRGIDTFGKT